MNDNTRKRLMGVSTATLTTVLFKRGLKNTFLQKLVVAGAAKTNMVGQAYTLRYIPAREDLDSIDAFNDRRHPQRVAIEECPAGHVLVMDSRNDPSAASAGGLLLARLLKRGVAGVVTDGGFRDTPEIASMAICAYHQRPSAPTNLIKHHAADVQLPIACGGVAVYPDDIIVVDDDGAVLIPAALIEAVLELAVEQERLEAWIMNEVEAGAALPGLYPPNAENKARYEASKTKG